METRKTALHTQNYKFCEATIELYTTLEEGTLALAKRLKSIRELELYKGGWESFALYLEEMKMSEGRASKLISVYDKWVVEGGFSEKELSSIGWTNLYEAKDFASRKVLDELTSRRDKDARDYIHELKSGVSMDTCKHADVYKIEVCRTCGQKTQILE